MNIDYSFDCFDADLCIENSGDLCVSFKYDKDEIFLTKNDIIALAKAIGITAEDLR